MVRFIRLLLNEKGRFLWSAHRITERQKAGKARSIKGKQLKNSRSTVSKQLVELLSSQRDNQIYIAYQLRSFDFGVSFCVDFGSSEQSSCGAAKNSPQDCFFNAATVLKEIIVYLLLSTPKSLMALGIFLPSGPRSKAPAAQLKTVHRTVFLTLLQFSKR